MVESEDGMIASQKVKVTIIRSFFDGIFHSNVEPEKENIQPREMFMQFTIPEVKEALAEIKNGKSLGVDQLTQERFTHGPTIILSMTTLNETASIELFPTELKRGILIHPSGSQARPKDRQLF